MIAFLLLVVGGINWLLLGIFSWEIGYLFGGADALISRGIYVLVGIAAIYELLIHKQVCKQCSTEYKTGTGQPSTITSHNA